MAEQKQEVKREGTATLDKGKQQFPFDASIGGDGYATEYTHLMGGGCKSLQQTMLFLGGKTGCSVYVGQKPAKAPPKHGVYSGGIFCIHMLGEGNVHVRVLNPRREGIGMVTLLQGRSSSLSVVVGRCG